MTNFRFAVKLGLLIAALSAPSLSQNCTDQPGCLDTTFGNAGFVSATVNNGLYAGWAVDVAVQPDGKIVVAADSGNPDNAGGDWYVLRFNSD